MKKVFLLLALAGVMVACGGGDKKDDKKGGSSNPQADALIEAVSADDATVGALVQEYYDAYLDQDEAAAEAALAKVEKLSRSQQLNFEGAMEALGSILGVE